MQRSKRRGGWHPKTIAFGPESPRRLLRSGGRARLRSVRGSDSPDEGESVIGNMGPLNPFPNFDHASTAEAAAWGACLGLAAALVGWSFRLDRKHPRAGRRQTLLQLGALALVFLACGVSVRDHAQDLRERVEANRQAREAAGPPEGPVGSPP